jgi:hypothetical protein
MSRTALLEGFVDLEGFGREVKRHPRTIRRWIDGGLPFTRAGNTILIHIPTAREWLFSNMQNDKPRRTPPAKAAPSKSQQSKHRGRALERPASR